MPAPAQAARGRTRHYRALAPQPATFGSPPCRNCPVLVVGIADHSGGRRVVAPSPGRQERLARRDVLTTARHGLQRPGRPLRSVPRTQRGRDRRETPTSTTTRRRRGYRLRLPRSDRTGHGPPRAATPVGHPRKERSPPHRLLPSAGSSAQEGRPARHRTGERHRQHAQRSKPLSTSCVGGPAPPTNPARRAWPQRPNSTHSGRHRDASAGPRSPTAVPERSEGGAAHLGQQQPRGLPPS